MINKNDVIHLWYQQLGKKGGASKSTRKAKASRLNGKKGGRPRKENK